MSILPPTDDKWFNVSREESQSSQEALMPKNWSVEPEDVDEQAASTLRQRKTTSTSVPAIELSSTSVKNTALHVCSKHCVHPADVKNTDTEDILQDYTAEAQKRWSDPPKVLPFPEAQKGWSWTAPPEPIPKRPPHNAAKERLSEAASEYTKRGDKQLNDKTVRHANKLAKFVVKSMETHDRLKDGAFNAVSIPPMTYRSDEAELYKNRISDVFDKAFFNVSVVDVTDEHGCSGPGSNVLGRLLCCVTDMKVHIRPMDRARIYAGVAIGSPYIPLAFLVDTMVRPCVVPLSKDGCKPYIVLKCSGDAVRMSALACYDNKLRIIEVKNEPPTRQVM